jgi:O-antigen/teichoic acid export membrane protein
MASITLPSVFILMYYSSKMAGFFSLSQNLIGLPTNMLTMAISQVFLGESAKWLKKESKDLANFMNRILRISIIVAAIPSILAYFFAPYFFELFFGKEWIVSGKIVQILLVLYVFRFITTPFSHILNMFGYNWLQFLWDIARLLSVCLVFIIMGRNKYDFYNTLLLYSAVMGFYYILHYILCFYINKKRT